MGTHTPPLIARRELPEPIASVSAALGRLSGSRSLPGRAFDYRQDRSERISAAVTVIVLHAAAIALVLLSRAPVPTGSQPGLVAFDVAIGRVSAFHPERSNSHRPRVAASVEPTLPQLTKVADMDAAPAIADVPAIADQSPQAAISMEVAGGCDLTQPVQAALRNSAEVRRQLPAIPADSLSVANAITVWNAGWIEPDGAPTQSALRAIRQTITQSVATSSQDCRNQVQSGPRLLYLPWDSAKTMVLALGSGRWTWQKVIDGTAQVPAQTVV